MMWLYNLTLGRKGLFECTVENLGYCLVMMKLPYLL